MSVKNHSPLTIRARDFNLVAHQPELMKQLRKLTLHPYSGLNKELDTLLKIAQQRPVRAQVLLAYHQEKIGTNPKLVGWALVSKEPSEVTYTNSLEPFHPTDGVLFEVYIHPNYRRQGLASQLIMVARRKAKPYRLCVAPWDEQSRSFYNAFSHYKTKWL
jgi:ribosomal protein S18 acetylase RimI-like enzyme